MTVRHKREVTVCDLYRYLRLDEETGHLFWRERQPDDFSKKSKPWDRIAASKRFNSRYAGQRALSGALDHGYLGGSFLYQPMKAHRVVFAMSMGHWPKGVIDHIDGDPKNNRPTNLRDTNQSQNCKNSSRRKDNTSGFVGVSYCNATGRWRAQIASEGNVINLGRFDVKTDAVAARKKAEARLGFHENHGR